MSIFWCREHTGGLKNRKTTRSGGLTTRIHIAIGVLLKFLLSGGQARDVAYSQPLLDEMYIPSLRGRPRKRCRWLLADKGYDAEALRRYGDRYRMTVSANKQPAKDLLPRLHRRRHLKNDRRSAPASWRGADVLKGSPPG